MTEARKDDSEKPKMGLISSIALDALAKVLTHGAKKYSPNNWRNGFVHSRPYDAMQRHLVAYNKGEDIDADSGFPHLWCAFCELMFLIELRETHPEMDDRWKPKSKLRGVVDELLTNVATIYLNEDHTHEVSDPKPTANGFTIQKLLCPVQSCAWNKDIIPFESKGPSVSPSMGTCGYYHVVKSDGSNPPCIDPGCAYGRGPYQGRYLP